MITAGTRITIRSGVIIRDIEIHSGIGGIPETTRLILTMMVLTIEVTVQKVPGVEGRTIMETVGGGVRMEAGT